jgi:hypothetical protein
LQLNALGELADLALHRLALEVDALTRRVREDLCVCVCVVGKNGSKVSDTRVCRRAALSRTTSRDK